VLRVAAPREAPSGSADARRLWPVGWQWRAQMVI